MGTKRIINLALIGHSGAGKTTIAESIAFSLGIISKKGSVAQGNTLMDFDPEEIRRKISINLACASLPIDDLTILNLIDTPGYFDFEGEVRSAIRVADNLLYVVNNQEGVEVGTENYWNLTSNTFKPAFFFVNRVKIEETDPLKTTNQIREIFGNKTIPVQFPIGKGFNFQRVIDLVDINEEELNLDPEIKKWHDQIMESIIETDEELMDLYFRGEPLPKERIHVALKEAIRKREIFPILYGDALENIGIKELIEFIKKFATSYHEGAKEVLITQEGEVEINPNTNEPVLLIFKTLSEAHVGELFYVKVLGGTLTPGIELINARTERSEKINQIFTPRGKERIETDKLESGNIGVLVKLKESLTGDTLRSKNLIGHVKGIEFPEPKFSIAIVPRTREDEEKVSEGLTRLRNEDPTFLFYYDAELKQTIISGLGEVHLDVIVSKLREKFGVNVNTERPKIPYRETIRKPATGMGKYVKQTGGRGQYGICYIKIEPLPRGQGYEFVDAIYGGAIPQNFRPAVETGIKKSMEKGVLANVKVVDVRVTLYDGKYHPVDSSNLAFEIAGALSFKDAEEKADPYLLEPIYNLEVIVPEEYMGEVIGDINQRRGKILGMESMGKYQKIKAQVPLAELYRYSTTLQSITKGRGTFKQEFSHYDEVPKELAQKVIQELKKEQESKE